MSRPPAGCRGVQPLESTQHSSEHQGHTLALPRPWSWFHGPFPPLLCSPTLSAFVVPLSWFLSYQCLWLFRCLPLCSCVPSSSLLSSLRAAPRLSALSSVRTLYYFTSSLRQNFCFCPSFPRGRNGRPLSHTALQAQGAHFCLLSSSKRLEPSKETLCPLGLASWGSLAWNACSNNLQSLGPCCRVQWPGGWAKSQRPPPSDLPCPRMKLADPITAVQPSDTQRPSILHTSLLNNVTDDPLRWPLRGTPQPGGKAGFPPGGSPTPPLKRRKVGVVGL